PVIDPERSITNANADRVQVGMKSARAVIGARRTTAAARNLSITPGTPARGKSFLMIGMKVMVRLRMSSHDAHYAGELVDGARMLGLFGDLATEVLIRLDGDEGLFRAYETVEFIAPVFAGDYIEATAELIKV